MAPVIEHSHLASVYLWLDYRLCQAGQGFKNFTGVFTPSTGRIQGHKVYAAPFRQLVYDSSIVGASVLTGFYEGKTRKTGVIDYNKGAILLPSAATGTISGVFSYKEVNLYPVDTNAESLLFEKKYSQNPRHTPTYTGYNPYDQVYPAIFIENEPDSNTRLCFEGLFSNIIATRLTVLADSPYLLASINRLIMDSKERHIPIFEPSDMPFNYLGNLKSGFNYESWQASIQSDSNRLALIKDVFVSKFNNSVNEVMGPNIYGSFIDIDFEILRPRT